uniref:Probable membrane transporter protein n=1 Tax=Candidatus Kentrum sp. SD TaxID=2126332 RepID=A0A450YJ37_9GAMM|nr:MAG: hypothetical protein BECKSD772F_GA0070984_10937 [Candidatus Kentron sp. SD]VFK47572.1 MAG: hypothetical protein BECKSD772E_GA0070983_10987 [Candidatus Kentron sp. SD]VFK80284.1 MAG: hypothetical protein BECKSD772D_GA0070982_10996 [Candidatus Kentron sp. SD]
MEFPQLSLIWIAILAAAILRAFTGFGFALAAMPVFSLFLTPIQSIVLCMSLVFASGVRTRSQHRGKIPLKPLAPLFAMTMAGTVLGTLLLLRLDSGMFQLAIGMTTISACLVLARYHPKKYRAGHPALMGGVGLVSGFMNGAFGIPGPPIVAYVMATESDPAMSRAFLLTFFWFSSAIGLATHGVAGLVTPQSAYLFLFAYPAMYLGEKFGHRLFLRYGEALYRKVALTALFLIGVSVTMKGLWY